MHIPKCNVLWLLGFPKLDPPVFINVTELRMTQEWADEMSQFTLFALAGVMFSVCYKP